MQTLNIRTQQPLSANYKIFYWGEFALQATMQSNKADAMTYAVMLLQQKYPNKKIDPAFVELV